MNSYFTNSVQSESMMNYYYFDGQDHDHDDDDVCVFGSLGYHGFLYSSKTMFWLICCSICKLE